ncbi:MAG TPA: DUF87 domain-containing protein [Thermoanaerobaculia bacterium]|nr:DUF87 domain-containing protein [Thermoanaerobaculia bacterium]
MSDDTAVYEKLGAFYLGRPYDLERGEATPVPLLYDSRDLVTHAVCVGMTGSGKTGLLVGLIEEAAIDGIPALVIDPKGDLSNLLLTFPGLAPADFAPWVDPDAAARNNISPEELAAREAATWKNGLGQWGQGSDRIARLREAADFAIYTPGSEAGLPVSILASFDAPPPDVIADGDLLRERIGTLVASLLGLLDIDSDPLQGRESILLATIFDAAWRQGKSLDLATLIQQIQKPPIERVGVMDIESFYPAKERFGLSMAVNNLLGSPGFAAWLTGEPLDVDRLLYTPQGKPRVAVFSIAHLSDRERMFFVSLLLNQTLGWMRGRTGTSSLRALLVLDEVFGYMPPVAEPPSKRALLTLLKQARAFGLGLVLATQNPVDLDYKGLGNVGTWFLGRLQTERDKARLMDGLQGAAAGSLDRGRLEEILSNLGKRVFLLHDVHEEQPVVFQTRWTLSYLRGPLTRPEIKRLMDPRKQGAAPARPAAAPSAASPATPVATEPPRPSPEPVPAGEASGPPALPPEVSQRFLPVRSKPAGILYEPALFAVAKVHYTDKTTEHDEEVSLLAPLAGGEPDWYAAQALDDLWKEDLEAEPASGARFAPLPDAAVRARSYTGWQRDLEEALYRTRRCELFRSPSLGEVSRPGELERDFRIRLADAAREKRDAQVEVLRKKHAPRVRQLEDRIRRAAQAREKQSDQARRQTWDSVLSAGTAVASILFGSRRGSTFGRASTAVRGVGRAFEERQDVSHAEENLESLQRQLAEMNAELEAEIARLDERFNAETEALETVALKPRKQDVEVRFFTLAWAPKREGEPAW